MSESAERALIDTLENELSNKELLLVLDNFEQVLDAVRLVGELLSSCSGLKVLVTSRTLLRVYGEYEYPVRSLELPDPRRLPLIATLRRYEAIRLFVERARVARSDFYLTTENAPAVAEICARLDGLPLAIELAAARIKLLSPQAICSRLGDPLKFLTGGARNLPERQRTLRGAIAWSHAQLSESEQILFARLAVFSGGCYLEAVEAICAVEDDYSVDILEVLSSLLDKSLLRREEVEEEPRFSMLETLREYARERLEASGEAEKTRRLHAEYFLGLAEEDTPKLRGSEEAKWVVRLETEYDNMRAALSWTLQSEETELGLRLAGALWQFWDMRGHYSEGRRWLEEALARDGGAPETRARVLEGVGWLADVQGDIDRAVAAAEEGLRLSAQTKTQTNTRASFLRILGSAAYVRGDHRQAARLCEESLALSRRASDERGVASSLHQLGNVSSDRGDYEEAKKYYEEGLALSRKLGDTALLASTLTSAKDVLRLLRQQVATVPDELTWGVLLFSVPPASFLPEQMHGTPVVAIAVCYAGPMEEGEQVLRPLREFGPPLTDLIQPMPYNVAQTMADILWPPEHHYYWKSSFLKDLSDDAIDSIVTHFAAVPSPQTVVIVDHNGGGAISRVGRDETAFAHREWTYNFLISTGWANPADSETNISWTHGFWEAMQPFMADALYVNYTSDEGEDLLRAAYAAETRERLVALKNKYDPTNLFHLNQNIKPNMDGAA